MYKDKLDNFLKYWAVINEKKLYIKENILRIIEVYFISNVNNCMLEEFFDVMFVAMNDKIKNHLLNYFYPRNTYTCGHYVGHYIKY